MLSLVFECTAQNKTCLVFSRNSETQLNGTHKSYQFFYMVDSTTKVLINGCEFYRFTFSEDPKETTGYIHFDIKNGTMFFVRDTANRILEKFDKLWSFKGNSIVNDSKLLSLNGPIHLLRKSQADSTSFQIKYDYPQDSHAITVTSINFRKGKIHPESITFSFPFSDVANICLYPQICAASQYQPL